MRPNSRLPHEKNVDKFGRITKFGDSFLPNLRIYSFQVIAMQSQINLNLKN